jgi:hypothetical protein
MRFPTSGFFHESVSKSLSIPIGLCQIFQKFTEISAARGAPPVSLTLLANGKSFKYFVWTPLGSGVNNTSGKSATGVR